MLASGRERTLAFLTAAIVGLLALDRLLLSPGLARWDAQTAGLAEARETLLKHGETLSREEDLRQRWSAMAARLSRVNAENVGTDFLTALKGFARDSGIDFSDIHPNRKVSRGDFDEYTFETSTKCPTRGLSQFLYRIDGSPEFIAIPQFSVTAGNDGPSSLNIALRLSTIGPSGRIGNEAAGGTPEPAQKPNTHPYEAYRVVEDRSIFDPHRPKKGTPPPKPPPKPRMKEVEIHQQVVRLKFTGTVWVTDPDGFRALVHDVSTGETKPRGIGDAVGNGKITAVEFGSLTVGEGDTVRTVNVGEVLLMEETVTRTKIPIDAAVPPGGKETGATSVEEPESRVSPAPPTPPAGGGATPVPPAAGSTPPAPPAAAIDSATAEEIRKRMMEKRKKEQEGKKP
ncbi:MAG: hypothetical protein HYY93_05610 [Planctomycetes bacterium]|nr:hypothetical protein [Planctomycetota bacterium]